MAIKIDQKIVKYRVRSDDDETAQEQEPTTNVIQMHEKLERPEMLLGSTYKIKTPLSEHNEVTPSLGRFLTRYVP